MMRRPSLSQLRRSSFSGSRDSSPERQSPVSSPGISPGGSPTDEKGSAESSGDVKPEYVPPSSLRKSLSRARKDGLTWLDGGKPSPKELSRSFECSFVHQWDAADWGDTTCAPLVALIQTLHGMLRARHPANQYVTQEASDDPTAAASDEASRLSHPPLASLSLDESLNRASSSSWLSQWKPLQMYQHGSLSGSNVLVDVRGQLWLIDFANSGTGGHASPFADAAKMMAW